MIECSGSPIEEFAERYLTGELSETEAERFEEHYFECEACYEQLVALQDVQAGLASTGLFAPSPAPQPIRLVSRPDTGAARRRFSPALAGWGALAAAILAAAVLTGVVYTNRASAPQSASGSLPAQKPEQAPAPQAKQPQLAKSETGPIAVPPQMQLALLADRHIPGFQAPELRSADHPDAQHQAFASGMLSYSQGDCKGALNHLEQVSFSSPDGVAARLYIGLCQFRQHELMKAQSSFEQVIRAGETPQLETAEYFLAQTMLLRSDPSTARIWLRRTVALHGDYEARAQTQLSRLVRLAGQPWRVP